MDDFEKNREIFNDYKNRREEVLKNDGQKSLSDTITKKLKTTMIGSISSIENHLGFLWGHDSNEKPTEDQLILRDLFQQVRTEILDKGNAQSRNIDSELSQYEIKKKRFNLVLPVKIGKKGNE
jgi:hypothetical protein